MENNQLAAVAPPPPWLHGFKLPGYTGESRGKGDGVIADPATQLDPSAKAGPLVTPLPDARTIGDWITAIIPDQAKNLVDYVTTAVGGDNSLPSGLVGVQDNKSGQRGNRQISGPLSPASGGTGDAMKDFEKLTGGNYSLAPADSNYPSGTLIGENGVALRPGKSGDGSRIDIPANGSKPHETLHY